MKLARLVALSCALLVAGAAVAEAQGGPPRGGGGRMNIGQALLQDITLTAEQKAKTDSLVAKFDAERQAAMQSMRDGGGDMQTARAEMQKMQEKFRTELRAVLTAEQHATFDRNVEALAQRQQQQRRPPPAGRR